LGTAINIVCTVKDKIIEFFTKKRIRFHKLFLQGKATRFSWSFSGFFTSVGDALSKAASAVVSGAIKVKNAVVDGIDWAKKKATEVADFIKAKLTSIFQPVLDIIEGIKAKFSAWLNSHPFIKKVFEFIKCGITNKGWDAVKGLVETVKNFIEMVTSLATPAGWVKLLVTLVCGWEDLKAAIGFLQQGLKATDKKIRYNFYGKFLGRVIKTASG